MSAPLLSVGDLHISFGGVHVLQGVNLAVDRLEIRGLIGPNGAGKTTLLNAICGMYRPRQGSIQLDGASIVGRKPSDIAQLGLGRTFQTSQLFKGMTGAGKPDDRTASSDGDGFSQRGLLPASGATTRKCIRRRKRAAHCISSACRTSRIGRRLRSPSGSSAWLRSLAR